MPGMHVAVHCVVAEMDRLVQGEGHEAACAVTTHAVGDGVEPKQQTNSPQGGG